MKTGKTLTQLAQEIERQRETRVDFIAPTDKLAMEVAGVAENPVVVMAGLIGGGLTERPTFNQLGHRQLGSHVGVPAPYYDRMLANAPELLAANVNHWLHAKPEKRMVRTLDGKVRAFLSDAYRPLDNHDLAEAVLPVLLDQDLDIVSCEITERRLAVAQKLNVPRAWVAEVRAFSYGEGAGNESDIEKAGKLDAAIQLAENAVTRIFEMAQEAEKIAADLKAARSKLGA